MYLVLSQTYLSIRVYDISCNRRYVKFKYKYNTRVDELTDLIKLMHSGVAKIVSHHENQYIN